MASSFTLPLDYRILIVDDEPSLLEELSASLTQAGWQVESAPDAMTALEKLESDESFAVLLTDIAMPGLDGLSLARRICDSEINPIPREVILLTGHGSPADAAEARRIGAFEFLSKPVSLKRLLDTTERAYRSARDRRQSQSAHSQRKAC
jgi:DNA-binding NtrC family response regulator